MATNQPTNVAINLVAEFDFVATRIHELFDPLIAQLIARKDALLLELSQLREDYIAKEKPLCPCFKCPTLHKLESLIADFGEVVAWKVPDYTLKKEPVLTAGKYGTGPKELKAAGLAIDESDKRIYIADCANSRIQIVSFKGDFIERFGHDKLRKPCGIAVTDEHIFITDIAQHALFQFHKNNFKLINRTGTKGQTVGQFNFPRGLCIDYSGHAFVADTNNDRVCVFSKELQFVSTLGVGQLKSPKAVKLTPDCLVVVLDSSPKCVHFFYRNGHPLSCCVSQGVGPDCLVSMPIFFCLDTASNLIISDRCSIKIITRNEQLIHTVGRVGNGKGELVNPFGISVSETGTIFVVSYNKNFSIQCF